MNGAIIGVFLVIIAYLVMMLAIGFFYSKGNNDSSDFYLGGRKLGPFVTAMSAEASDMSSWLLMGLPGVAYLRGICDASWTAIGLAIVLSVKLDAPAPCRLDAPDLDLICYASADCLHQHLQVI